MHDNKLIAGDQKNFGAKTYATVPYRKLSSKSFREDMCRLPTSFLLNTQSRVKQEEDMPQIQNSVTQ